MSMFEASLPHPPQGGMSLRPDVGQVKVLGRESGKWLCEQEVCV